MAQIINNEYIVNFSRESKGRNYHLFCLFFQSLFKLQKKDSIYYEDSEIDAKAALDTFLDFTSSENLKKIYYCRKEDNLKERILSDFQEHLSQNNISISDIHCKGLIENSFNIDSLCGIHDFLCLVCDKEDFSFNWDIDDTETIEDIEIIKKITSLHETIIEKSKEIFKNKINPLKLSDYLEKDFLDLAREGVVHEKKPQTEMKPPSIQEEKSAGHSRREFFLNSLRRALFVRSVVLVGTSRLLNLADPRRIAISANEPTDALKAIESFRDASTAQLISTFYNSFPVLLAQKVEGLEELKKTINFLDKTIDEHKNPHRIDAMPAMMAAHLINWRFDPTVDDILVEEFTDSFNPNRKPFANSRRSEFLQSVIQSYGAAIKETYKLGHPVTFSTHISDTISSFIKEADEDDNLQTPAEMATDLLLNARWALQKQGSDFQHIDEALKLISDTKSPQLELTRNLIQYFTYNSDKFTSPVGAYSNNITDWKDTYEQQGGYMFSQLAARLKMIERIYKISTGEIIDHSKAMTQDSAIIALPKSLAFIINHDLSEFYNKTEFNEFLDASGNKDIILFKREIMPGLIESALEKNADFIEFEKGYDKLAPYDKYTNSKLGALAQKNAGIKVKANRRDFLNSVFGSLKKTDFTDFDNTLNKTLKSNDIQTKPNADEIYTLLELLTKPLVSLGIFK